MMLAQQEAFKDELLSILAHELRTPLTSIVGFCDLLRDGVEGDLSAEQKLYMNKVGDEVNRLNAAVSDLLEATLTTSAVLSLQREDFDVPRVIEDAIATAQGRADARGVGVQADLSAAPPVAFGDETRVAQVLTRLIANAIAFSPRGGAVTVRAAGQPNALRVEVTDAGPGIPESDHRRLFRRFGQLDMSSTRAHPGLGLGLYLCRRLVEAHGGCIGVRSQPNAGSTFWFTLPGDPPPPNNPPGLDL